MFTFQILAMAHATFFTPGPALIFTAVLTLVFLIPNDFDSLVNAFSFTAWLFYGLVFAGVIVMRFTHPDMPRQYKVSTKQIALRLQCAIYIHNNIGS